MDYDLDIEAALCPDEALRTRLQRYRANVRAAKMERLVSMRFVRDAWDMKQAGWSDERIDRALFAGWSADEIAKAKQGEGRAEPQGEARPHSARACGAFRARDRVVRSGG
jgi:hypothetical protein